MKNKTKAFINIDKLIIAYNDNKLKEKLSNLHFNNDFNEISLIEVNPKNPIYKNYNNAYNIYFRYNNERIKFGLLYFGSKKIENNFIYIKVDNEILYNNEYLNLIYYIEESLYLRFHHIYALDICYDTNINLIKCAINMGNDKEITPIILDSKIKDNKAFIKNYFYICSGTLDNPIKYKSLYIRNKEKDLIANIYDKRFEIDICNNDKKYISDRFENCIYRFEVRAQTKSLFDTIKKITNINQNEYGREVCRDILNEICYSQITNKYFLFNLFIHLSNRLIRINKKREIIPFIKYAYNKMNNK